MPNKANDVAKLLDNGWTITLFRNVMDSYTVRATQPKVVTLQGTINHVVETDDLVVPDALYRLVEKVTTGRSGGDLPERTD